MNTEISLKEFAKLITTIGKDVSVIGQGEMGIGKSSVLKMVAKKFPTYKPVYLDAALLDLGDLQMPSVDKKTGLTFVPNCMFVSDQPLIIMIDEIGKAMRPVQNALMPLMLEHRIGSHQLPKDSIVFATTNLTSDGVGDNVQSIMKNRGCWVTVSKPNADEWVHWAGDNDIDPAIQRWVMEFPHCLGRYTDESQKDNPYIFNPRKQQAAFVTPRSLEKASHITKMRMSMSPDTLIAALSGTLGESAARDLQAYLSVADALPSWESIMAEPLTAVVPINTIAQSILALGAATRLTRESVNSWLTYFTRLQLEVQSLFVRQVMDSESRSGLLCTNKIFVKWAVENHWVN